MNGDACARCGAALAHGQEYCVECGQRQPLRRRPVHWLWPVAVAALVAAGGAAAAIAAGADDSSNSTIVALTPLRAAPAPAAQSSAKLRSWPRTAQRLHGRALGRPEHGRARRGADAGARGPRRRSARRRGPGLVALLEPPSRLLDRLHRRLPHPRRGAGGTSASRPPRPRAPTRSRSRADVPGPTL